MTNNVFGGTLNLAPSIYLYGALLCIFLNTVNTACLLFISLSLCDESMLFKHN